MMSLVKFFLIGVFSLILEMPVTHAQEISPYEQIADFYHQRAGAYSCEFASTAIKKIKSKSEEDIKESVESSLRELDLKLESRPSSFKDKIISGLESVCRSTRVPFQKVSHSVALTNSVLVNSAALSIGVPLNLFKGAVGNKKAIKREDFIYHVMGPKRGEGPFLLGFLLYQSPDLLLGFNPAFALVNGSIAMELITNYQCRSVNPINQEKLEFCETYQDLKNFFQKGNEKSFALGLKIKRYLNKRAQTKQNELGPEGYCSLGRAKQVELARKTLERNDYFKNDQRIKSAEVLLPIHKNTCTKILIQSDEDLLDEIRADYKVIDSIPIEILKDGEYPQEYYFSEQELNQFNIEEQLCHDVERDYFGELSQNQGKLMEDFFKVALAPSLLSQPQTKKIILRDDQVSKGQVRSLRNVILSLAPVLSKPQELKSLQEEREKIIKEIKRNYKKIIRSKNFENCLQVIKDKEININAFTSSIKRLNEIQSHPLLKRQQELDVIKKIMKRSRFSLKLNWELIESNQLSDVISVLKRPDVGNVILIGHGKSSGHFVDSDDQEFPREAFAEISPSIMSINLYTCHSQKLIDLYQLEQKLSRENSLYKIRFVTNVAENDFLNSESYAPLAAFGDYLGKLDRYLFKSLKGAILLQENYQNELPLLPKKNVCHADLTGLIVKKGNYGIILNDQLIGATSIARRSEVLEFGCDFLKRGSNTLKIKNISNEGGSELDLNNLQITIGDVVVRADNAILKKNSFTLLKFDY